MKTEDASTIFELEQLILARRKELVEWEKALLVIKQMLGAENKTMEKESVASFVDEGQLKQILKLKRLSKIVPAIVEAFPPTQDITVRFVEDIIRERGGNNYLPSKNPRGRLAMLLQKLKTEGKLKITVNGKGSEPNIYRKVQ